MAYGYAAAHTYAAVADPEACEIGQRKEQIRSELHQEK